MTTRIDTMLNMLCEFRAQFGQYTPPSWADARDKDLKLQADLIEEEFVEYYKAERSEDIVDALGDMAYVSLGANVAAGIKPASCSRPCLPVTTYKLPFEEQAVALISTLRKQQPCYVGIYGTTSSMYWRLETATSMRGIDLVELFTEIHLSNMTKLWDDIADIPENSSYTKTPNGMYIVRKNENGKIIKSPRYRPVDLTSFC